MRATLVFQMLLVSILWRVAPLRAVDSPNNNNTQVQPPSTNNRTSVNRTKSLLYLLVLLPYPDLNGGPQPSWSGGPNVLPAIEMAVEDINRKTGILGGYTLDFITGNSGCNVVEKTATSLVKNVFYSGERQPVGIIGPGCSASALHTTPITGKDEVALISAHGAGTPELERDKEKYPYVFGGFASLTSYAKALAGFIEERGWTQIAVLYDASRVAHESAFKEFSKELSSQTVTKIEFSSGIYPTFIPLDQIKEKFLKIVVILAGPELVRQTLCMSYHEGFSFPIHQFLVFERHLSELVREDVSFNYSEKTYFCSKETMLKQVLEGVLLTEYRVSQIDGNFSDTINGTSHNDFTTEYKRRIKLLQENANYMYRESVLESIWGAVWYDLVWAMATALNNAELYEGVDLQTYGLGMKNVTKKIYNQFQALDFEGMSGRISFEGNSTFVQRTVDVHQINNTRSVYVAAINGSNVETVEDGVYAKSEYPIRKPLMHTAATVVVLLLVSVITLALLVTHLLTIKYRSRTAVKGSSPRLQQLAYVGCYLLIVATVSITVPQAFNIGDTVYIVLCHVMNTCFSCGYTLIIGTVCAKTWRLYRIFCHYQKPGKMLADHFLFTIVILLVLVDVVVNVSWAAADHFEILTKNYTENTSDGDAVIVVLTQCTSDYQDALTYAIIGYNVCILLVAVYLAILTRKVHLPQFQTKTVVIHAYVLFLLFGLGIPLKLVLDNHYIWIAMFLATTIFSIMLLFLPPLLSAFTKGRHTRTVHAQMQRPSIISLFSNSS